MATHYQVLGVHRQSERASIRTAYLNIMKRCHPDRIGSRITSADVYRVNQAYSVLRDPRKRARYDAELSDRRVRPAHFPPRDRRVPVVIAKRRGRSAASNPAFWVAVCIAPACVSGDTFHAAVRPVLVATAVEQAAQPHPDTPLHVTLPTISDIDPGVADAVLFAGELPRD